MNKERRKQIGEIIDEIEGLKEWLVEAEADDDRGGFEEEMDQFIGQIESLRDEEQDYFDNMPENFQNGEKGDTAQSAISAMDSAIADIDQAKDALQQEEEGNEWATSANNYLDDAVGNLSDAQG